MYIKPNQQTVRLFNKNNRILSTTLDVPLLKINLKIGTKSRSDYGWYHNTNTQHIIKISEFVIGTPSEENIIQHELCHAYVDTYFPEEHPHGHNFKELSNKIFGHNNVKKPYVNDLHLCEIEIDYNQYKVFYKNKLKSVIKIVGNEVLYLDENEKPFKHENTGAIYGYILKRIIESNK